jgi:SAM-dependent methyltransferase
MFPGGGPAVDFYRDAANRQGGRVLELGCGTGHKLIPIASDGHPCVGLDFSSDMLTEAQRKADESSALVEWVQGEDGSSSTCSTRACAYSAKPTVCGAPDNRCRSWILTGAR